MVCEHNVCLACHTRTLLTQVAVVTHMLNTLLSTWKINLLKNLCPLHSVIACHSLACMPTLLPALELPKWKHRGDIQEAS